MIKATVAAAGLPAALALVRQDHLRVYEEGMGLFGLFFLFAIIGGCGYCYFSCCRGRSGGRGRGRGGGGWFGDNSSHSSDSHRHHHQHHQQYDYRQPPPVHSQQVYQGYPPMNPMPPMAPMQARGPVPQNNYRPQPPPYISNDITRAANQSNSPTNWEGPDHFASQQLREDCGFCHEYQKYGEEPRLMLNCHNHHAFHVSCLNQHRVATSRGVPIPGTTVCPVCGETSEDRVRFFCTMCKERYVWVDLRLFSDPQGVIDTTRLVGHYGEYCSQCRSM